MEIYLELKKMRKCTSEWNKVATVLLKLGFRDLKISMEKKNQRKLNYLKSRFLKTNYWKRAKVKMKKSRVL